MKLTQNDQRILKEFGHPIDDILQIEKATSKLATKYTCSNPSGDRCNPITRENAIHLLGRTKWLTGLSRSAFHWSATMQLNEYGKLGFVSFDSSRLFQTTKIGG